RSQRRAVAAIARMVNGAHVRIGAREVVEDRFRRVRAAVVDDDHLEVGRQRARHPYGENHQARDRSTVVVGGEEHAEPGWTRRALVCHGTPYFSAIWDAPRDATARSPTR